jgi:exopolysaccharide biosynthesis polyprenyl glycosylphosphotransferase
MLRQLGGDHGGRSGRRLKAALVVGDALAAASAWALVVFTGFSVPGSARPLAVVAAVSAAAVLTTNVLGLHRARVCSVRSTELVLLARVAVAGTLAGALVTHLFGAPVPLGPTLGGGAVLYAVLASWRSGFDSWIKERRRRGRYRRDVLLVGTGDEGLEIEQLLADHPELGYRVRGVIGPGDQALASGFAAEWLGGFEDTVAAVRRHGVSGVVLVTATMPPSTCSGLVRDLMAAGVHVHVATGLRGIAWQRLRFVPLAHEPLLYLERPSLGRVPRATKRAMDLVLAVVGVVVLSPVFLVAALAVKLCDRGPVLFRQERVGLRGRPFTVMKFRTMGLDAEAKRAALEAVNERQGGPLFKLTYDPRVTRVGRYLRDTSIDELPQLFNVIKGDMTLVGPRPALPAEVAEFDGELLERLQTRPGMTGLWQVEARDNPSFRAYRRLDLFYVDNWSIALDVLILLLTVHHMLGRGMRVLLRRPVGRAPAADERGVLVGDLVETDTRRAAL